VEPGCKVSKGRFIENPLEPWNLALCDGAGAVFRRSAGHGLGEDARRSIILCQGHVDVFKEYSVRDPSHAVGRLDEVVAGAAGLFAAERVGKDERFRKLTSAHQKSGAVNGPLAFKIHKCFFHPSAGQTLVAIRFRILAEHDRPLGGCLLQVE